MDTSTTATTAVANALRLRAAEPIAEVTMAFHFDKPAGFAFRPGQAIELLVTEAGGIGITPFISMLRAVALTDMAKSARSWDGATQLVDAAFLREAVGSLAQPVHYVVGPPAMVEAMRATLAQAGVDDDDVRSEDFYGY